MDFLQKPIEYVKGVGPDKGAILRKELKINTVGDLLQHFPYRYIDRSKFNKISEAEETNSYIQIKGILSQIKEIGVGRTARITATISDNSGSLELVWFNSIKWVLQKLKPNEEYVVFGKPSIFNNKYNITHPEIELSSDFFQKEILGYQPLYNTTEKMKSKGLDSRGIWKIIREALATLNNTDIIENLPQIIIHNNKLISRFNATKFIHQPKDPKQQETATYRIKYEEFFLHQLRLIKLKVNNKREQGLIFASLGDLFNTFYEQLLPFALTNAQKRVLKEIRKDTMNGRHMNRLLQGDVGSGKTIVALLTILMALDNGFQAAFMAPTEILAQQHFNSITELIAPLGIQTVLLTGSVKGKERKKILAELEDGTVKIIIGTHALLEDKVVFQNLGIVIIDEQHRFGVAQRAKLRLKNTISPHTLVMTATPIPRSLAMVFYGDLDHSVIDELPPGRKPIKTIHRNESARLTVFGFLRSEIELGRQIYIVYPLIDESEKLDLANLMEGYESICRAFPRPQYQVSVVHGRMKPEDKEIEMQRFLKKETQIMVATTVIEVGVNIPNASVMVIENSERFGLSQLHQLRGRVGRGADQSYCILMTGQKLSNDGKLRINTMCNTNDGFKIAEVDLEIRGPGDIEGTQQSGTLNLKLANIALDKDILEKARMDALNLLENDPNLDLSDNFPLKIFLNKTYNEQNFWTNIL
jgi:ATP-dependent DNA helicase RecG